MVTAAPANAPIRTIIEAGRALQRDGGEVRVPLPFPITDEYLEELARSHELLRFEASAEGELIISGSTWGMIPDINRLLLVQLSLWMDLGHGGIAAGAERGFHPPGWLAKIPDVSWASVETVARALAAGSMPRGYWPVSPDFVIETKSRSDSADLQLEKTQGWADHGTRLALLVDPDEHAVHICRPHRASRVLIDPDQVSCEPELPGLILDFRAVWKLADAPYDF